MAPQQKKAAPVGGNTPVKKEPTPKPDNSKLTDKQERFIREYLIDLNATQAAIRSGYSEKTAQEQSSRLLSNVIISTRIREAQDKRAEELEIDAKWVLNRLVAISNRCMQAEPVKEWNAEEKAFVETGEFKFDSQGANKATEMIGKHIGFFEKDNDQKKGEIVLTIGGKEVNE